MAKYRVSGKGHGMDGAGFSAPFLVRRFYVEQSGAGKSPFKENL